MKRAMHALGQGIIRLLTALVLVAVIALAALAWKIDQYGRVDQAQHADAIIVLGAQVLMNGQPGPDLSARTDHAVALYNAGYAANIITTGGFADEPLSAASVARRAAIARGVPAAQVWMAEGSQSTQEDAQVAAQVMREHSWQSAILVSHPLHLYRAQVLFQQTGVQVYSSPTNTHVEQIAAPWRVYYAGREAASLIWVTMRAWMPVRPYMVRVESWAQREYAALHIARKFAFQE